MLLASFVIAVVVNSLVEGSWVAAGGSTARLSSLARCALIVVAILAILFDRSLDRIFDLREIATGDVAMLKALLIIPMLLTVLTVGPVVFTGLAWTQGYWYVGERTHYTLVTLGAVVYVWFLNYWNLLGWRF
jgi:hypothetical protein